MFKKNFVSNLNPVKRMRKLISILALLLFATACETESLVVKNTPQDNLTQNAALMTKLKRVSQFSTTADNFVDGTSAFALQFPVTIVANGQTVVIASDLDYDQVRSIFNQSNSDVDSAVLQFPVSVTFVDYTQATFATQVEFNAAAISHAASIELSCLSLAYPIEIKTYDTRNQSATTVTLNNKKALFAFLDHQTDCVASLSYPIVFDTPDGILSIADNTELETQIDAFTAECESRFDETPNPNPTTFEEILATGSWYVSYFFRETDQTSNYTPYDFTFNADGSASVTGDPPIIAGTWVSYQDEGELRVNFVFSSAELEELEEAWTVAEFNATLIKMRYESGGSGTRYFNLTRN